MTSVVIVDDHHLFRAGVRAELDGLVDVLGDAATVEDAVRLIVSAEPDVVVLDVHMPGDVCSSASPPWRRMRPTIDSRTPRRSGGIEPGSKPGPRSRTKTCRRSAPASA